MSRGRTANPGFRLSRYRELLAPALSVVGAYDDSVATEFSSRAEDVLLETGISNSW